MNDEPDTQPNKYELDDEDKMILEQLKNAQREMADDAKSVEARLTKCALDAKIQTLVNRQKNRAPSGGA